MSDTPSVPVEAIRFNDQDLVPAIIQDYLDGTVLMMAWMNAESLMKTLETGRTWFWSRSRHELWPKGATSGHVQHVQWMRYDCDSDALLIGVEQVGDIACHTGERSCFHRLGAEVNPPSDTPGDTLTQVFHTILSRRDQPQSGSYTNQLLKGGTNKILKKVGEETAEFIMACKDDDPQGIASEAADVIYHLLVALAYQGVNLRQVYQVLAERRGTRRQANH